jgi:hypothetical protein
VKKDLRVLRQEREPGLYFLDGVVIEVARVDEQHIDLRTDSAFRAPIGELPGKRDVIALYKRPILASRNSRAIVNVHAYKGRAAQCGHPFEREGAFPGSHAQFNDELRVDRHRLEKQRQQVIGNIRAGQGMIPDLRDFGEFGHRLRNSRVRQ